MSEENKKIGTFEFNTVPHVSQNMIGWPDMEPRPVAIPFKIIRQGDVVVKAAYVVCDRTGILLVELQTDTKYMKVGLEGSSGELIPWFQLSANLTDFRHNPTMILFPDLKGWHIWAVETRLRNRVAVCFVQEGVIRQ